MKTIHKILAVCLLMSTAIIGTAQTEGLPTITENGRTYYLYTVQKSEGIYRISKKFNITQDELIDANPILETQGLKLDQTIRIPAKTQERIGTLKVEEYTHPAEMVQIVMHTIKPKETLYGISKQYGITIEQLVQANPEVSKTMQVGQQLVIPQDTDSNQDKSPQQKEEEPANTQTWQEEINGLVSEINAETHDSDSTATPFNWLTSQSSGGIQTMSTAWKTPIRIGYLLPLQLEASQTSAQQNRFVEFLEGSLLSINDITKRGIRIELHVYDAGQTAETLNKVISNPELQTMDLLIGPAYSGQVKVISDFALAHRINTIIPFTNEVPDLSINPYLIQFNSRTKDEVAVAMSGLERIIEQKKQNYVILHLPGENRSEVNEIKDILKAQGKRITEVSLGPLNYDTITSFVREGAATIFMLQSVKTKNVQPLSQLLRELAEQPNVYVMGSYSWLGNAKQLGFPFYLTSIFEPTPRGDVAGYEAKFRKYYKQGVESSHPRYDMLGYDITSFFICATYRCGSVAALNSRLGQLYASGYITSPHFVRTTSGKGYINEDIRFFKWQSDRVIPIQDKEEYNTAL